MAEQTISNDRYMAELLELLVNNQMQRQTEEVRRVCRYVETLEKQLVSMTNEIKTLRQDLILMRDDTFSKHMKDGLQKTADTLQKQCDNLKQQVKKVKENISEKAAKVVEAAKQRGRMALYQVAEITGVRKKLLAIKGRVEQAVNRIENLEQSVTEYYRQQGNASQKEKPLLGEVLAEPQAEYGAELFERYKKEHGTGKLAELAGQMAKKEVEKAR